MSTGERTRRATTASSLSFAWFPQLRVAPAEHRQRVANMLDADPRRVGLSKVLLNPKHPAVKEANEYKSRIREYWVSHTLPYVQTGVRLVPRGSVAEICSGIENHSANILAGLAANLDAHRDELLADARQRLGEMFDPADYPASFAECVRVEFRLFDVEPPEYLRETLGTVYDAQMEQVAAAFTEAAKLAEHAFADELLGMVDHLRERLEGSADEAPRIFRDSAVNNLREFFTRFRGLDIESSEQLREQVGALESLLSGVTPNALRSSDPLRDRVRSAMGQVAVALEPLTTEGPRRRLTTIIAPAPAAA